MSSTWVELKEKGNVLFKSGDNAGASSYYTEALKACPEDDRSSRRILHSNRSAARLKCGDADGALRDADDCLSLGPGWSKGLARRSTALLALRRYADACKSLDQALIGDPSNTTLQEYLVLAKDAKNGNEISRKKLSELFPTAPHLSSGISVNTTMKKDLVEIDPLASFFDEIAGDIEQAANPKRTEIDHDFQTKDWTSKNQLERILQKHHRILNLNPYHVFAMEYQANDEDIKKRFHKLSSLLHPDKNPDPNAREAFEFVTKAYSELKDISRRQYFLDVYESCKNIVQVSRENSLKAIYFGNEQALIQAEGLFDEAVNAEVKKYLALAEQERLKAEKIRAANEAFLARSMSSKETDWSEFKRQEDIIKEGADERAKDWMNFQTQSRKKQRN